MPEADIVAVKRAAQARLRSTPGVSGVGIGPKFVRGQRTGELAIQVFVVRKRPVDDIPVDELIPPELEGFKTDVFETGPVQQLGPAADREMADGGDTNPYAVLRGGIQIESPGGVQGTLGCFAYAGGADRRQVLVTCQHILHDFGPGLNPGCAHSVGQPTGQPSCELMDFCAAIKPGGRIVAHERRSAVLSFTLDGAIADLVPGVTWRPEIQDDPNPVPINDVYSLQPDDIRPANYPVYKRGRTTRKTTGWVLCTDFSATAKDQDNKKIRDFDHAIKVVADSGAFALLGDSGAALMNTSNEMVGLLFGMGDSKIGDTPVKVGVASHIMNVTAELGIEIATTANTPSGDQSTPSTPPVWERGGFQLPRQTLAAVTAPPGSYEQAHTPLAVGYWPQLLASPLGVELVNVAMRHRIEIRALARTCARVIAGWRRYGGPQLTRLLQEGAADGPAIPPIVSDRPFSEAAQRFADIVLHYASAELAADVRRCAPRIAGLGGMTYPELLDACGRPLDPAGQ